MNMSPLGENIKEVPRLKNLDVFLSCTGKFSEQVEKVVTKARQMMEWVSAVMLILYRSIVRQLLKYWSQVWSPKP